MAISRILSVPQARNRDDHLSHPAFAGRPFATAISDRGYRRDATIPEDRRTGCPPSVLSCTTWGFSCLVNYSASGELLPRLFNLACTSLPKNRRCLFCDTFRQPRLASELPACFTRHAAVWCSDFPLPNPAKARLTSDHLPSCSLYHSSGCRKRGMNLEATKPGGGEGGRASIFPNSWLPGFQILLDSFDHPFRDPIVDLPRSI